VRARLPKFWGRSLPQGAPSRRSLSWRAHLDDGINEAAEQLPDGSVNAPRDLPGEGDHVQFMEAEILDWMFQDRPRRGHQAAPEIDAEG
jgi:hypothetical protein